MRNSTESEEKAMNFVLSVLVLFIIIASMFHDAEASQQCEITKEQESVIRLSYEFGEPYDYGYTMVAIAMKESGLGKWKINLSDPSAGIFHTTIDKGIKRLGWKDTGFNRNRVAQKMIENDFFAAEIAIDTLIWWDKHHDGDWRSTVSSYNGGHAGNQDYVKDIINNIKTIKECGWLEEPPMITYTR